MSREKFNLIPELTKKASKLKGKKRLSIVGQGDFPGGNNLMRSTMNIKHKTQHITIHDPEFPMMYDGKENLIGQYSSFYAKADKDYEVIHISKKFNGLLNGKTNYALYFLYCKEDNSYRVIERKEVENLTENFGFTYNNNYIDNTEVGDEIPKDTIMYASTSYDEYGNVSIGVNGRVMQAIHPAVQDDAIMISESFANRMISDNIKSVIIPITSHTILLNIYGEKGNFQGLPNIGDFITNGIVAVTRTVKESRMFSDMRDISLKNINHSSDQEFYGSGEVIDINIYSNNPKMKINKVNRQLIQYYNDLRWFYTDVYKICKKIIKSGSKNIDREIYRWKRLAMNHLDDQAQWLYNDNIFSNMVVEILLRNKEKINIGRKIVGRHGNKHYLNIMAHVKLG